jgi:hypothetical protein
MKKIFYLAALLLLPISLVAQEADTLKSTPDYDPGKSSVTVAGKVDSAAINADEADNELEQLLTIDGKEVPVVEETRDTVLLITTGSNESAKATESGDTIKVRIGNKNIDIIEHEEKTSVDIYEDKGGENDDEISCKSDEEKKFRGHWAGVEIGLNNMLDNSGSISRTPEASFMELNASRSLNLNLNFAQYSIGFGQDRFGVTTGLGFEFCNYFFSHNNTIGKSNGSIISIDTLGTLEKSKLTTTYLRVPLILELQLFAKRRSDRVYVSAGIIGGVKLGSHTKTVANKEEGEKKSKNKDDFYLNPFRWGLTAHIGYKGVTLYGDYYPTPLFQKNKGPELYPFSAGLALTF